MLCKWICSSSKTFPSILKLRFCESGIFECQMLAIWTPTQTEFGQLQSNHLQIAGLTLGPAQTALPDPCHCSAFEFLPSNANPTQPKTQNLFTKFTMSFFFQRQPTQLSEHQISPGTNFHFQCIAPQASDIIVGDASGNSKLASQASSAQWEFTPKIHNAHFFQQ